jgi:Uma2 family endonuclease
MTSQKVLDWWLEMPPPDEELVFDDGEPMDSPEHRANAALLVDVARKHYESRDDVYVGANEALYFSSIQAKNRDFRAPDFFVVLGCDGKAYRKGWVVWNEGGKVPDLIIELLSPTTEEADRTVKFDTYRRLNVAEYVLFDVLTDKLEGYTLENRNYVPMPTDNHGHLKCASLGLSLGLWPGNFQGTERNWLRFFHPDGRLAPTFAEAEAQRAEAESQRAAAEARKNADLLARLAAYESRFGSLDTSGESDP